MIETDLLASRYGLHEHEWVRHLYGIPDWEYTCLTKWQRRHAEFCQSDVVPVISTLARPVVQNVNQVRDKCRGGSAAIHFECTGRVMKQMPESLILSDHSMPEVIDMHATCIHMCDSMFRTHKNVVSQITRYMCQEYLTTEQTLHLRVCSHTQIILSQTHTFRSR